MEDAIQEVTSKVSEYIGDLISVDIVDAECGHIVYAHTWHSRRSLEEEAAWWRRIEKDLIDRVHNAGHDDNRWAVNYFYLIPSSDTEGRDRACGILSRAVPGVQDPVLARAILVELQRAEDARKAAESRLTYIGAGEGTHLAGED